MKSLNKKILAVAVIAATSGQTFAYEAGDWIVRAGYAAVDPRDDSDNLDVSGIGELDGTGVGVSSGSALGITVTYMINSHWGVELLAATPFEHDITSKGLGALGVPDGTELGSVSHLPPTLSAQYYFLESGSEWQPYVGAGLNYTTFFDEDVSNDAENALGADDLSLDDSFGIAGEVGVDWRFDKNWLVNASVWYIGIETDASVDTALGKTKTTVTLDPWVYMIGIGYNF